jgi:hypothetical protein
VRITGQLIDAQSGAHVWAERFDGTLADVFDLQDRLAEGVAGAIEPALRLAEIERARRKPTESLDAYDLYLRALPHAYAMTPEGNTRHCGCSAGRWRSTQATRRCAGSGPGATSGRRAGRSRSPAATRLRWRWAASSCRCWRTTTRRGSPRSAVQWSSTRTPRWR